MEKPLGARYKWQFISFLTYTQTALMPVARKLHRQLDNDPDPNSDEADGTDLGHHLSQHVQQKSSPQHVHDCRCATPLHTCLSIM